MKHRYPIKKFVRLFGFLLALGIFVFNFTSGMAMARALPAVIFTEAGTGGSVSALSALPGGAVAACETGDETLASRRLHVRLFGIIELRSIPVLESTRRELIPCGDAVGISIRSEGLLIVGFGEIIDFSGKSVCPAAGSGLRAGDIVITANGAAVRTAGELQLALNADRERTVLEIDRDGRRFEIALSPSNGQDGNCRIGVWVRDSTVGIGTLSFADTGGGVAALGHAVVDADTGRLLPVHSGELVKASILGVTRGRAGSPGELRGTFSSENERIGSIVLNSALGVFGAADAEFFRAASAERAAIPVAFPNEVHEGEAYLIAQIGSGGTETYSCRIVRTARQDRPDQKGLVIEITDERLLSGTGGIVQGMSGSPIIQDGRLAGVITHVFVNDPVRGYGVYAYWMSRALEEAAGAAYAG